MHRRVVLMLGLLVLTMPAIAMAITTIEAGNHIVVAGNLSDVIPIIANTDGADSGLAGVNISVFVADGGTALGNPSSGPIITALDLTAVGSVFGANNTGNGGLLIGPDQIGQVSTTTTAGTVAVGVNQLLANVTIDTTGFGPGVYAFTVSGDPGTGFPASDYAGSPGVALQLIDGTITIVPIPEPSSVILGLFAAAGLAAVVIRRRRRTA